MTREEGKSLAIRTIAIGDIHGCAKALATLLDAISPEAEDTIVVLGDVIDRGPDSRGVLQQLLALERCCRLILLMGNHEEMLLNAMADTANLRAWLACGGVETLLSYGWTRGGQKRPLASWFPDTHRGLLGSCLPYFETASHLFVHAGYVHDLPLEEQPGLALRWKITDAQSARMHDSGKVAVVGHTPQQSGEILDLGFLVCIDTSCVRGGWLTALETSTGHVWQADRQGKQRVKRSYNQP